MCAWCLKRATINTTTSIGENPQAKILIEVVAEEIILRAV
jgi:hypothetical protein